MNRILFEPEEIDGGVAKIGGARAEHIIKVLHGEIGQTLKTGEINGLIGTGVIKDIAAGRVTIELSHTRESLQPWADLILAPPRPRVMKRLLPQLAAMGVGRICLVGAKKVEKDFWGATLLKEEIYRPLLVDGLMQAGTTILPVIETHRSLRKFLSGSLRAPSGERRIIAHPASDKTAPSALARPDEGPLLLAVGPEGGWTDEEVALFEERGFSRYSLGPRILRTDTALIALLARLSAENAV